MTAGDIKKVHAEALRDAQEFELDMGPDEWFDLWHTHVDWDGDGNDGAAARRPFLEALFIILDRLDQQAKAYPHPYQLWAWVLEEDSSQDAVFLHSKNPNSDNFPLEFDDVDFDAEYPEWLHGIVKEGRHRVGRSTYNDVVSYYIFLR